MTSVSEYLKNQTRLRFNITRDIEVIPNFVDTQLFIPKTSWPRKCFAAPDEKVLMHISNFRPVKRIPDIIEVFEGVAKQMKARLILIGHGPEKEMAISLVEQKGLGDIVHFLGLQSDVSMLISCADLYLLLSEHESFGLTALEAMSCGVPVVGTSESGMDEFLGDGQAGCLFPVGDITAMVEGCIQILANPDRVSKMGKTGRERALKHYSKNPVIDLYENLYQRVMETSA